MRRWAPEIVTTLLVAVPFAFVVRATVAEARFIPSGSMLPTLQIGDRLVVEKLSQHFAPPKRGDILVFFPPQRPAPATDLWRWLGLTVDVPLIKRTIGLAGETVAIHDGQVFINGQALTEPYVQEPPLYTLNPTTIPQGHLFMLGDNRNNSVDSHIWGSLPLENVIGHAVVRFWPIDRLGPAR